MIKCGFGVRQISDDNKIRILKQKKIGDMMEKYNTRVRQMMSDEYVKCSKRKCQLLKEYEEVAERLKTEKDTLSYRQYKGLECEADNLKRKYENEKIRLDVWDQAREICLNIADEAL